jgi:hypothetical protein
LIDAAGPLTNALLGFIALLLRRAIPVQASKARLFVGLVTTFSFFWESAYLVQAALTLHGDLYFFARWAFGPIPDWQRWVATAIGVLWYILTIRFAVRLLLESEGDPKAAKSLGRTVWLSATAGATLAAITYSGDIAGGFRDAVLEIGLASIPLLFIPNERTHAPSNVPVVPVARSIPFILAVLAVFAVFVATLGRGLKA